MDTFAPEIYSAFRCIGSRCGDNCCIGWEIELDEKTAGFYKDLPGPFGQRLRDSIWWDMPPSFKLGAGERCPFLNGENLCDIILTMGEEGLCQICDRHPRFRNQFPDRIETGLGLCCEEAARLILGNPQKAHLTAIAPLAGEGETSVDEELLAALREGRETAFALVQSRELPIRERAALLLLFGEAVQGWLDGGAGENPAVQYRSADFIRKKRKSFPHYGQPIEEKRRLFEEFCRLYQSLEQLDSRWAPLLAQGGRSFEVPPKEEALFWQTGPRAVEYEQLLWTWLYRYWMEAAFDEDIRSRTKMAAANFLLVYRLGLLRFSAQGKFELEDQVDLVRSYAKEVEYSPENMETLADAAWENPAFEMENLMALLIG